MLDKLRQIAIFVKTVEHGSFRGAAAELRLSPSVVSHHIAQLEDKLGVALLYRSTRRLTLTREGERLFATTQDMLNAVENGLDELRGQSGEPAGALRVTLPSVLAPSPLTEALAAFSVKYPKIKLELDLTDARQSLVNEGYDLGIRMATQRERGPNRQTLFETERALVASSAYLAEHSPINHPKDLAENRWIEFLPARAIKPVLRKSGEKDHQITLEPSLVANQALALYRLAKSGAGIAVVPLFLASEDIAAGTTQVVLPDWKLDKLTVFAEWPHNAPKNGLARLLVSELKT